jgi:hypothetical protein
MTVKNRATSPQSQSDWNRVDRMKDEEIDLSDLPEIPPEAFARAIVRKGLRPVARKAQITANRLALLSLGTKG